jgi:hypothetical protein
MVGIKDLIKGKDPMERYRGDNTLKTAVELVDRSGPTGYSGPFATLTKLSGVANPRSMSG